jgi:hypothetical protein
MERLKKGNADAFSAQVTRAGSEIVISGTTSGDRNNPIHQSPITNY